MKNRLRKIKEIFSSSSYEYYLNNRGEVFGYYMMLDENMLISAEGHYYNQIRDGLCKSCGSWIETHKNKNLNGIYIKFKS